MTVACTAASGATATPMVAINVSRRSEPVVLLSAHRAGGEQLVSFSVMVVCVHSQSRFLEFSLAINSKVLWLYSIICKCMHLKCLLRSILSHGLHRKMVTLYRFALLCTVTLLTRIVMRTSMQLHEEWRLFSRSSLPLRKISINALHKLDNILMP